MTERPAPPASRASPAGSESPTSAAETAEQVVRDSYGRLVAYLASLTRDIAEAEDALADALAAALQSWPVRGIPARPDSWLITVARRNLIGGARRRDVAARALPILERLAAQDAAADDSDAATDDSGADGSAIPDRRLQLLFACAHPAIDPSMRSPLMLQTVLGLDAVRIARAFVVAPATMGQRLVRAKAKIKRAGIPFAVPPADQLDERLADVLDAIYAAYGSGWDDLSSDDPRRVGLTDEAIRLVRLVTEASPDQPEARGLLALMLHSHARRDARRDDSGELVALHDQDMTKWSRDDMLEGERHLATALAAHRPGPYQLHAAIQSIHNLRVVHGSTNWPAIASLYDALVVLDPTLGALVARATAHGEVDGPDCALTLLDELPADRVEHYQPYHAVRAHWSAKAGDLSASTTHAERAIELADDPAVREHLRRRHVRSE